MDKTIYEDSDLIEMIGQGRGTNAYAKALAFLYQANKATMIKRLKGQKYRFSEGDAADIYHQAISVLVRKLLQKEMEAKNLSGYLWGICQNLSLQFVDKRVRNSKNTDKYLQTKGLQIVENEGEQTLLNEAFRNLFKEIAKEIGDKCKQVLLWRQMKYSYREIALKLNPSKPSSEEVMRVTAGRCKKKLISLIEARPKVKRHINELLNLK